MKPQYIYIAGIIGVGIGLAIYHFAVNKRMPNAHISYIPQKNTQTKFAPLNPST